MVLEGDTLFDRTESSADEYFNFNNIGSTNVTIKLADETTTASAVLQDDDELFVKLTDTNSAYKFRLLLIVNQVDVSNDFKVKMVAPAGSTGAYYLEERGVGSDGGNFLAGGINVEVVDIFINDLNDGDDMYYQIEGGLTTGATSGNLQLQWAQRFAGGGDNLTIKAGSLIEVTKLN